MSTLTGNDVYGLMEAYQAVYAPQELTEEQVWEEVEEWVNTLIEEGYDLSDYTWEEMFEAYIEEQVPSMDQMVKKGFENQKFNQGFSKSATQLLGKPGSKPTATPTPSPARTPAPAARTPGVTPVPITRTPTPTRTPAPAAKPAATTPAKPSGTTPTAKPAPTPAGPTKPAIGTTAGGTKFERRAATGAELRAAQAARKAALVSKPEDKKGAEEAAVKSGVEAGKSASKPAVTSRPSGFGVPTAPLAAKLSASTSPTGGTPPKLTPRQAKLNMEMEYDAYDIVLEHLLDEGYADTEESALAIMTNMSEEWKQSIVEAVQIPPIGKPQKYIVAPSSSTPRPDMSTPKDKEIGRRISQTPIGMRLTGPTGPLR